MFAVIGLAVVCGSVLLGYTMHGGKVAALMQFSEFIIIGGAATGSVLAANSPAIVIRTIKGVLSLLKGNPYTKACHMELLQMLYDIFMLARREGLVALDEHAERPSESKLFANCPFFFNHHHALSFMADTLKVLVSGGVATHDLSDMMDIDLETSHEEALKPSAVLAKVADAMPGFGIVAAVLGVVITMSAIGGPPEQVGEKVAAALVGTFIGVLMCYGVFGPVAMALEGQAKAEEKYMACIKCALLSFARGDPPLTAVEFARRNIEPIVRPSFSEMEQTVKTAGRAPVAQAA